MNLYCAVPHCGSKLKRPRFGLCARCERVFHKSNVAHAGFIPTTTVGKIARSMLKTHGASKSEVEIALRIARGTRHREGPWNERPPYRLTPLLTGTVAKRRPQLLVGKRQRPNMAGCVAALVQAILCEDVLEAGNKYGHVLAGMTYFGTRGLYAPPGVKPDQGPYKHSIYRLNTKDYGIVATQVLKACRAIGLNPASRDLRAQIVAMYLQGQLDGIYPDPVYPPRLAMRTTQVGDHPLDFRLPRKPWVEPSLQGKIVRSGGTINRKPVTLKPMQPKPRYRRAEHRPEPKVFAKGPVRDTPGFDWIFGGT